LTRPIAGLDSYCLNIIEKSIFNSYKEGGLMNENQKIVLSITVSVLILLLLFPPFAAIGGRHLGYRFIFIGSMAKVNVGLLLVQSLIIIITGVICFFALKARDK